MFLKAVAAVSNIKTYGNNKEVYTRTCVVTRKDQSIYFQNKTEEEFIECERE